MWACTRTALFRQIIDAKSVYSTVALKEGGFSWQESLEQSGMKWSLKRGGCCMPTNSHKQTEKKFKNQQLTLFVGCLLSNSCRVLWKSSSGSSPWSPLVFTGLLPWWEIYFFISIDGLGTKPRYDLHIYGYETNDLHVQISDLKSKCYRGRLSIIL